jgi:hypothetical protein
MTPRESQVQAAVLAYAEQLATTGAAPFRYWRDGLGF